MSAIILMNLEHQVLMMFFIQAKTNISELLIEDKITYTKDAAIIWGHYIQIYQYLVVHQYIEVTEIQIRLYCHYEISSSSADDVLIKPPIAPSFSFIIPFFLCFPPHLFHIANAQYYILTETFTFFLSMKIEMGHIL